jgi:hypothetical protein
LCGHRLSRVELQEQVDQRNRTIGESVQMKLHLNWTRLKEENGLKPNRKHSVQMESRSLSTIDQIYRKVMRFLGEIRYFKPHSKIPFKSVFTSVHVRSDPISVMLFTYMNSVSTVTATYEKLALV